jgi:hypothetical protein
MMQVFNMLSLLDSILAILCLCFLIEQVFYWLLGSYPYRYGVIVKTISLSSFDINYWDSIKDKIKTLNIKTRFDRSEVYIKYRYPSLLIGPSLFIGQIKGSDSGGVLHIKVGPLSGLFALFLIIYPFLTSGVFEDTMFQLMNVLIVIGIIAYLYFRFLNSINRITLDTISR